MSFLMMCMQMQAQMWSTVAQTWVQMMTLPFGRVSASMKVEVRSSSEAANTLRDDLRAVRRRDCIWPEDITRGGK